jgi:serine protease AprX
MTMRRGILLLLAFTLVSAGAAWPAPAAPRLSVEAAGGRSLLFAETAGADGAAVRHLLRETAGAVRPLAAGWDPAGKAGFLTWSERGGERWVSYSRDEGRTWSDPQSFGTALKLHAGDVEPGQPMPPVPPSLGLPAAGRLYLVQFRSISLPEWRQALNEVGAEVLSFFPHNAHIVRMDPGLVPSVAQLAFVERVEPYHPAYRLEPELRDRFLAGNGAAVRVQVVAFAWGPEAKSRILAAARAVGARPALWYPSGHILELWATPAQIGALAAHDDVMWIDRWSPPEPDMDNVRQDAGTNWLETNHGTCGQGVRGEVLDEGVDPNHMDFDGIMLHGTVSGSSHGTATYGIVFGNGDRDGDGNAQGTGQMPSYTACPSQGIMADYDALTDRFAHTMRLKQPPYNASFQSNSWGNALTTQYTSVSHQMDDLIWQLDMAIAQSQSNAGTQLSRPQAWAKNIISVGGIRHFNTLSTTDDSWTGGASIGPAADGRIKPDVSYWYDSIFTTAPGGGYTGSFGGTSAATPMTAGVLGLIVQMWSENVWGSNPQGNTVYERQPHFSTIKALLVNSSQQYPFSGTGHDLTRTHQGWGRPSVRVARERSVRSFVIDETRRLEVGQTATYTVNVLPGESELRVTMAYPDPPGTLSATLHRINDLSLRVTSPTGTVYHGNNGLLAGTVSTAGGNPNTIDTVENVIVPAPTAGAWTVVITAAEINQDAAIVTRKYDDAAFGLVVTGAAATSEGPAGN